MQADPTLISLGISLVITLPAILLALTALLRSIKGEGRIETMERAVNGERDRHVRALVQDAWDKGRLAGLQERDALYTPPPPPPPTPPLPPE